MWDYFYPLALLLHPSKAIRLPSMKPYGPWKKASFPALLVRFEATAFVCLPNLLEEALLPPCKIGEYFASTPDLILHPPLIEQHDPSSQPMDDVNSLFHLCLHLRCNLTEDLNNMWSDILIFFLFYAFDPETPPHSISFLFSHPLLKIIVLITKMLI